MIPKFPEFKKLELTDKEEVEKITGKFPPYSDFNFVSMWSWDIKGEMRISKLNNNLVVRFTDYLTGNPFFSFLGDNMVNETVDKLLELSKKEGFGAELKLVPEEVIKGLDNTRFKIEEDRDNFDYIYNIEHLSSLKGTKYETHRNQINQFSKKHINWKVNIINFHEIHHKKDIINLYEQWLKNKGGDLLDKEYKNEFLALSKLLTIENLAKHNLVCFAVYIEGKLIGFIINEHINDHNIIHFEKAHIDYKGSYPFLMQQNSKILQNFNLKYLNFEQDLGIEALKFTKNKLRPSHFLKKYLITN